MKNLIYEYQYDPDKCDLFVELFHEAKEKGLTMPGLCGQHNSDSRVETNVKKSTDLYFALLDNSDIDPEKYKMKEFTEFIYGVIDNYLEDTRLNNIVGQLEFKEPLQIHHYAPGEGFYALHGDSATYKTSTRVLVFILYLNDVKDGGTFFPWQDYKSESKKGNMIVFPASYTHPHRGVVSYDEDKYILTGWVFHSNNGQESED